MAIRSYLAVIEVKSEKKSNSMLDISWDSVTEGGPQWLDTTALFNPVVTEYPRPGQ